MSNQNLSNIAYENPAYTIIFILVTNNADMFSFINNPRDRMDFFWNRWGKWRDVLQPYSVHAFLVKGYNTKSGSGMGFTPEVHLCEFINIKEAQIFNAEYLMQYNKIYSEADAEAATEFSCEFGMRLMDVQEEREAWVGLAEKAARRAFNGDVFRIFFGDDPIALPHVPYDLQNIVDAGPMCEMLKEWVDLNGEECPVYAERPEKNYTKTTRHLQLSL